MTLPTAYPSTTAAVDVYEPITVRTASDLPAPSAGVITLADRTEYFFANDFSTSDRFVLGASTLIRGPDSGLVTLTYTGTGVMFTSTKTWRIERIRVDCATGTFFSMIGTGAEVIQVVDMTVTSCDVIGNIEDIAAAQISNVSFEDIKTNGISFTGNMSTYISATDLIVLNGGTMFDLGTATFDNLSIDGANTAILAAGTTFLSGAAASANINAGGLGSLEDTRFSGTGTRLSGVTTSDALWQFFSNDDIPDTRPCGLASFNTPTTTTAAVNTPTLIVGTWTPEDASQFTMSVAGRGTYNGGKDFRASISCSVAIEAASGSNKNITAYIAKDGTVVPNSGITAQVSSNDPRTIGLMWEETLSTTDFVEIFIENNTDGVGLTVNKGTMRLN